MTKHLRYTAQYTRSAAAPQLFMASDENQDVNVGVPMAEITQSTAHQNAPKLSSVWLTTLLLLMCIIPMSVIAALFVYMPQVHEGQLEASISADGLPSGKYYEQHYAKRPDVKTGDLIVKNESDQDWTHLNIKINRHYQIYERNPIPSGEERRFKLDRFVSRTGATFDLRYNPLSHVRIYARRPTRDRATFASDFDWESVE